MDKHFLIFNIGASHPLHAPWLTLKLQRKSFSKNDIFVE